MRIGIIVYISLVNTINKKSRTTKNSTVPDGSVRLQYTQTNNPSIIRLYAIYNNRIRTYLHTIFVLHTLVQALCLIYSNTSSFAGSFIFALVVALIERKRTR